MSKLGRGRMSEADFRALQVNHVKIIKDLYPDPLIDHLYTRRVIDEDELDIIKRTHERSGRGKAVEKMLDILRFSGSDAFRIFIECLESEEVGCKELASEIKRHRYVQVQQQ